MKIRFLRVFTPLIMCAILGAGCKSAGITPLALPPILSPASSLASPQPGSTVGGPFIPGEVIAALPVYTGATPTTYLNPGFGPPSFPSEQSIYVSNEPGYQSASAQYTAPASAADILGWYLAELGALGYTSHGEDGGGGGSVTSRSIAFVLPSQSAVSVQVHVYSVSGSSMAPVFELLVTYIVPLPKPTAESLPGDIQSVKIDYLPGTSNEVTRTITDTKTINNLVNLVDNLPVSPGYARLGPMGVSPQTLFTLTFHSISRGDIVITDVTYDGVHFGDYPLLADPQNLFQQAVQQILGIQTH